MEQKYTCVSCHAIFPSDDSQREHYRSEYHRYNLKRKIVGLPPLKLDEFEERIVTLQRQQEKEAAEKQNTKKYNCTTCRRFFKTENAFKTHNKSSRHTERVEFNERTHRPALPTINVAASSAVITSEIIDGGDEDIEEVDEFDYQITDCLFCTKTFGGLEANLEHMTLVHSFFIPDYAYICDIEGFISHLGQKITDGNICLVCNEKGKEFKDVSAVRAHMVSMHHCMVNYDEDHAWEYSEFYDYSSTYPDYDPDAPDHERASEPFDFTRFARTVCPETGDLVLSSGKRLGNKAFDIYYKQTLTPDDEIAKLSESRALAEASKMQKDLARFEGPTGKMALYGSKWESRRSNKWYQEVGVKANKLQCYFRHQNPL